MNQPASRAYVIAIALIGAIALAIITTFELDHRLGRIEHTIQTIEHHKTVVVTMPCVRGNDQACRTFIRLLLSDATRAELRTLLGAKTIHVPARGLPRLVGQLQRLLHHHRHRRHRRRLTIPRPPSPFSPIPPVPRPTLPPEGVMPVPKPHPGNGLPGRPRHWLRVAHPRHVGRRHAAR